MALPRITKALVSLVVLTVLESACSGVPGLFVVRPMSQAQQQGFNATAYVNSVWSSKVIPAFDKDAVPVDTVLAAIQHDPLAASQRYGRQESSGGLYAFMVKGAGRVLAIDRSSALGLIAVDLPPFDGKPDLFISIGPAFVGTAVRDAAGFIHFSQFVNQLDYADVATALNDRVRESVVNKLADTLAANTPVSFEGAFSLLDPNRITVTPVRLSVNT